MKKSELDYVLDYFYKIDTNIFNKNKKYFNKKGLEMDDFNILTVYPSFIKILFGYLKHKQKYKFKKIKTSFEKITEKNVFMREIEKEFDLYYHRYIRKDEKNTSRNFRFTKDMEKLEKIFTKVTPELVNKEIFEGFNKYYTLSLENFYNQIKSNLYKNRDKK